MKIYHGNPGTRRVVVTEGPEEKRDFRELPACHEHVNHSPDGFAWGYGGSGPHQLAFAILFDLYDRQTAFNLYNDFCHEIIAKKPMHVKFRLTELEVQAWVDERMRSVRWRDA